MNDLFYSIKPFMSKTIFAKVKEVIISTFYNIEKQSRDIDLLSQIIPYFIFDISKFSSDL